MALVAPRPIHLAVLARKACACEVEEAGGRETGAALVLALAPVRPAFALIRLSAKLIEVIVVQDKILSRSLFARVEWGFQQRGEGLQGRGGEASVVAGRGKEDGGPSAGQLASVVVGKPLY